ncbi:MAG: SDR family oxidoreductase [Rhodospirillaceae bacterium]|nr:SDR family oxidoreductase [Rhodospirillaceae bacterium]
MASQIQRAVVTGTSSGIGRAVAVRLLGHGWQVTGLDRVPGPLAGRSGFTEILADLADRVELEVAAARLEDKTCHALVHAAGLMRDDRDEDTQRCHGANLWALHVAAAARLATAVLVHMPVGRGRIVFLSSRAAQGRAGRGYYAASKAALDGLARSLAAEHVGRGITVNVLAPGATDTPQLSDPARAASPVRLPPLGRLIAAEEVAATVAFLVGADAGAITGQTIVQCAGASLAGAWPAARWPGPAETRP